MVRRRDPDPSAEAIYQQLVSEAGLFGKAFFGHKKTAKERRKLSSLWHKAIMLGGTDEQRDWLAEKRAQANEARRVRRAGTDEGAAPSSDEVGEGEGSAT